MVVEFTARQLSMMCDQDKAGIEQAKAAGFNMPRYIRMFQGVTGEIKAVEQLFSPAALWRVSGGTSYPASATPENCEKLVTLWNANCASKYAMA